MEPTFTRILVPTDFGIESKMAFGVAVSLARALGASISLVHVAPDANVPTPEWSNIDWITVRDSIVCEATARLEALAETARDIRITREVRIGQPTDAIVQAAAESGADLIVMGTHARGALGHLLLGSVAERVIRSAGCPVMTVRDSGAVHLVPREQANANRLPAPAGGR